MSIPGIPSNNHRILSCFPLICPNNSPIRTPFSLFSPVTVTIGQFKLRVGASPPARYPYNMQGERSDEDVISDPGSEEEEDDDEEEEPIGNDAEMAALKSSTLVEFRCRVEEAICANTLIVREDGAPIRDDIENLKDIRLWGVPLLPSAGHDGTDAVLVKFLKAKRYKVHNAFSLLQKTLKWRGDFRPDEYSGSEMDDLWFTNGRDKEGRLLFYTVLGREPKKRITNQGYQNRHLDYFRWRIQCVEKGIQSLDFSPCGVNSFIQIIDVKNAPRIVNREIKLTYRKMITLLKENYPGLVHRTLVVNVPSWFLALNALNLRYITQKGHNRFIFVKTSKVTETLLKYATIENIVIQYGGLKRENDAEFSIDDKVLEAEVRPNSSEEIKIPASEAEITVTWDVTVVGYEVMYREEFIPDDDCLYKVLLQEKKMGESIRNSFYIREPGNIVITIVNATYTKKKAFYRYKSSRAVPLYTNTKHDI